MEDGGDQFAEQQDDDSDQDMQGDAASRSDDKHSAEDVPNARKSRRQQRVLDSEEEYAGQEEQF